MIIRAPASDTAPGAALVESIRPGSSEPLVEPQQTPPAAKALPARACSAANQTSSTSAAVDKRSSMDYPEIQLWSLKRGQWRQSDRLQVDPSNPSLLELVAQRYFREDHSLYDWNLRSLSLKQCFRAATFDGSNALFMIHKDEEKKLAGEGWVDKRKEILFKASRVIDLVEDGIVEDHGG